MGCGTGLLHLLLMGARDEEGEDGLVTGRGEIPTGLVALAEAELTRMQQAEAGGEAAEHLRAGAGSGGAQRAAHVAGEAAAIFRQDVLGLVSVKGALAAGLLVAVLAEAGERRIDGIE